MSRFCELKVIRTDDPQAHPERPSPMEKNSTDVCIFVYPSTIY